MGESSLEGAFSASEINSNQISKLKSEVFAILDETQGREPSEGVKEIAKRLTPDDREYVAYTQDELLSIDIQAEKQKQIMLDSVQAQEQITQDQRLDEAQRIQGRQNAEVQRKGLAVVQELLNRQKKVAQEGLKKFFEATREVKIDRSTDLHVRAALLNRGRKTLREFQSGEADTLKNDEIRIIDLNNFKVGNTVEGHAGLDQLMLRMSHGFIAASQYLGGEQGEYGNYQADDSETKASMDDYFGKDDEGDDFGKRLLDRMKDEGITLDFYRDKTGGDEAFIYIKYNKGKTAERSNLAKTLEGYVYYQTTINKHTPEQLVEVRKTAEELPSNKILTDKLNPENKGFDQLDAKTKHRLTFAKLLSKYLVDSNSGQLITDNDSDEGKMLRVHMGGSAAEASLYDASTLFIYGYDDRKGQYVQDSDGNSIGLYTKIPNTEDQYRVNETQYNKVLENVLKQTRDMLKFMPTIDQDTRDQIVTQAIHNQIMGTMLDYKTHEMEAEVKPREKLETVLKSWLRDPEELYQVGSLVREGRLLGEIDKQQYEWLLDSSETYYANYFKYELQKEESDRNPNVMTFYKTWVLSKFEEYNETHEDKLDLSDSRDTLIRLRQEANVPLDPRIFGDTP